MSGHIRYTEEFKREAAAQVTDRGYSVKSVAERLGFARSQFMIGASFIGSRKNHVTMLIRSWPRTVVSNQSWPGLPRSGTSSKRPRRTSQRTSGEVRLHQGAQITIFYPGDVPALRVQMFANSLR